MKRALLAFAFLLSACSEAIEAQFLNNGTSDGSARHWFKSIPDEGDKIADIAELSDGTFVAVGSIPLSFARNRRPSAPEHWVANIDENGSMIWSYEEGIPNPRRVSQLQNGIILAASKSSAKLVGEDGVFDIAEDLSNYRDLEIGDAVPFDGGFILGFNTLDFESDDSTVFLAVFDQFGRKENRIDVLSESHSSAERPVLLDLEPIAKGRIAIAGISNATNGYFHTPWVAIVDLKTGERESLIFPELFATAPGKFEQANSTHFGLPVVDMRGSEQGLHILLSDRQQHNTPSWLMHIGPSGTPTSFAKIGCHSVEDFCVKPLGLNHDPNRGLFAVGKAGQNKYSTLDGRGFAFIARVLPNGDLSDLQMYGNQKTVQEFNHVFFSSNSTDLFAVGNRLETKHAYYRPQGWMVRTDSKGLLPQSEVRKLIEDHGWKK